MSRKFVIRHIKRAPVKSALIMVAALFFVFGLSWLQMTITRTEVEVAELYEAMPITAEIQNFDFTQQVGFTHINSLVSRSVINSFLESDFIREIYVIAGYEWYNIIAPGEDGRFDRSILDKIWEGHSWNALITDWHLAVSCLETFIEHSGRESLFLGREPFRITFADGFDESSFHYDDRHLNTPIPVIVHESILVNRGLEIGGKAFITQHEDSMPWWDMVMFARQVHIIGVYGGSTAGGVLHQPDRPLVVMPLTALEFMRRDLMTYITAFVEFDPSKNHELHEFRAEASTLLRDNTIRVGRVGQMTRNETVPMVLEVFDDDFNNVVVPMERNLELLRVLYPVAVAVSVALGAGLALLLMFQNAKNAAIMRVLGYRKLRVRLMLCAEQIIVTIIGIVLGVAISSLIAGGFTAGYLFVAGAYLAGAVAGGLLGAIVISGKPPLELLQVKE